MKKVRKIIPVSLYDIPGLERWLEEQANLGLFPVSLGSWATFEERAVPGTRFRLDPFANRMGEGTEPTPEKLELYRQSGWEYAFPIGSAYFLFYNTDPDAPELYTDYQSQGMSLERLTKRLRSYFRRRAALPGLVLLIFLAALFWPCEFDVQPAPLARLPLILLYLFHPSMLFFAAIVCFRVPIEWRDWRTLSATYNALKEGLPPPPSPGLSRRIVRENQFTLALTPVLVVLLLFSLSDKTGSSPLSECSAPYISLTELESVTVFPPGGADIHTKDNEVTRQFSLLAPVWYEVKQHFLSWETGREKGHSPDPEDGKYSYSPILNATYFRLSFPPLARLVAEARMDVYRAVNLTWSYEEVDWPDTDFVILARAGSSVHQMAAVCCGGQLAVFQYAGVENLKDHLAELTAVVQ